MNARLRAWLISSLPGGLRRRLKAAQLRRARERVLSGPALGKGEFLAFLQGPLRVRRGSVLCVHNSLDLIHVNFPPSELLALLREAIGAEGTLMFPVFPNSSSFDFLRRGEIFDVRRSPGYTGLLGELARRQPGAQRSLHPTRSMVALGPQAAYLTSTHQQSPYPFDRGSPFYLLKELGGQIIGIGISSKNLTFVHTVDDFLRDAWREKPYYSQLFQSRCRDATGREVIVPCYAHDLARMHINVPAFLSRHVAREVANDAKVGPMSFFTAEAAPLFDRMVELGRRGITIYHP